MQWQSTNIFTKKWGRVLFGLFFIFSLLQIATAASKPLQNTTKYDLILSHITLFNASCSPACTPMSILPPNAAQTYSFSATSGYIIFDYNILMDTTYVGHITIKATPESITLVNGLGGMITQGTQYSQISFVPPIPYWESKFTSLTNWESNNWNVHKSLPSWGLENIQVIASGISQSSPKADNFIRIHYPAGSAAYSNAPPVGGAQFYGAMINTAAPVTLSFYMLLPTNFPFSSPLRRTTVGKLPGLYGGKGNTGRNVPTGTDGWSIRFMWCDYNERSKKKFKGGGQLLQFTYQSNLSLYGHNYGMALGCGSWSFKPDGKWHNLQQTIHLNDIGKANGRVDVCFDGIPVFSQRNITFRTTSALVTNGILFQTFFGGSDKTYATPIDTYADFANFALYLYPPSAPTGLCVTNP
jgi:hypothetical protein